MKLEVDANQAPTVRRLFERYAAGDSLKRIAIDLNSERIASPQPQKGRVSQSWCPSSVRHILHNERYRGVIFWGKTYKLRSQETGKRIYRRKPATEWRRTEIPEQRIISDELWNAAQHRMQIVNELYALEARRLRARAVTSPYIFSGLLKCSLCGASITIVSGRSRKRQDVRYGCSLHYHRGRGVCPNRLLIARRALEEQLLAGLQAKVLHPDVMACTLDVFEEQLLLAANRRGEESAVMQRRVETIQKQIRNCTEAIAEGKRSPSLMERLSELEQELADTKAKMLYSEPREVKLRLKDVRRFAEARLKHLQTMFSGEPRIARAEIGKHVQKITLTPEGSSYIASGTWDVLGAWQHGWCRGPGSHRSHRIFLSSRRGVMPRLDAARKEFMFWIPVWARSVVDPLQRLSTRPILPVCAYLDII